MAQVETTIDSVRFTTASPERTIILKQRGEECYLPFWVSSSQGMQVLPIPRLPVKRQFVLLNSILPFIPCVIDETQQAVVAWVLWIIAEAFLMWPSAKSV